MFVHIFMSVTDFRCINLDQSLAGYEFFQPVGAPAYHVLFVCCVAAVFIEGGFAGDDQPVAKKTEQRCCRLVGGELDGELIHGFGFDDRTGDRGFLL